MGKSLAELESTFRERYPEETKKGDSKQVEQKKDTKEFSNTTRVKSFKDIQVGSEAKETRKAKDSEDVSIINKEAKERQGVKDFRNIPVSTNANTKKTTKKPRTRSFKDILVKRFSSGKSGDKVCTPRAFMISEIIFYSSLAAIILCTVLFSGGLLGDRAVGGRRFVEMSTPTMASVYPPGSLLVVEEVPVSELQIGDDISFVKDALVSVTQRIVDIEESDDDGTEKHVFVTRGVDDANDEEEVQAGNVIGRVSSSIPRLGTVLSQATRNLNVIIGVFIAFMISSFAIKLFWRER